MKVNQQQTIYVNAAIDGQNASLMTANGGYVWKDEKSSFVVKSTSGTNNPSWSEFTSGFGGLVFSSSNMNQVWVDFHIDHDIAMNTKIYPHIHWMPLTNSSGKVRWGMQYMIAKGHGQGSFNTTPTTIYIDHVVASGSQYKHMVSEVSDASAILSAEIEPDTVIKMRVFRDGGASTDTYSGSVHAWQADLHYQVARIGTVNRVPNFFGA